jgi:hypothetical protein
MLNVRLLSIVHTAAAEEAEAEEGPERAVSQLTRTHRRVFRPLPAVGVPADDALLAPDMSSKE